MLGGVVFQHKHIGKSGIFITIIQGWGVPLHVKTDQYSSLFSGAALRCNVTQNIQMLATPVDTLWINQAVGY